MRRPLVLLAAAALIAAAAVVPRVTADAAATLVNGGFEANGGTRSPSGWSAYSATGTAAASYTEAGGRTGGHRLTHYAAAAYRVETYQYLSGLANGSYTLRVWVRSSGGQVATTVGLKNCGGPDRSATVPAGATWTRLSVTTAVSAQQCTVSLVSDARAGTWANFDDVEFVRDGTSALRIRGADISTLKKSEDRGGRYSTGTGQTGDALAILRASGVNYARLKVWVNPVDGYNTGSRILEMARRIKAQGMGLLVDFHYSDSWADPAVQTKPAAWRSYTFAQLNTAVYNHTYDVLNALRVQGTPADMVQVGNELNAGMLWPDGSTSNFDNLATLLKSGVSAVRAVSGSTRVMLHLAKGGDNGGARWWFDAITRRGVPFDVIGLSHYLYWHGPLSGLAANLNDLASRYGRDVVVAETSYGFTTAERDWTNNHFTAAMATAGGYPASAQGQADAVRDLMRVVAAVPGGRGLGVFYWEPTWTAVPGNGFNPADPGSGTAWENQALFDYSSRALPAMAALGGN